MLSRFDPLPEFVVDDAEIWNLVPWSARPSWPRQVFAQIGQVKLRHRAEHADVHRTD
jgi:hypothetical protein